MNASELIRSARGTIAFAGGRTEGVPHADVVIETAPFNRIVEYKPADQVVTCECGVTLAALQRELAANKQRLALDPAFPERATLGGIVAANSFGPLRTRYGSVRDLIIGIEIIRADGTRAKGGGKVVKTVAGFDLPKLICGSRGALAMIATVTFRVHPLPEESATVAARGLDARGVIELVRRVRMLQLEPAAMMARYDGSYDLWIRFEGFRIEQQLARVALPAGEWPSFPPRGAYRFGALPTQLPEVEQALGAPFCWYPTLGLGFTDTQAPRAIQGGWFGKQPPPAPALHDAVKLRLDPDRRLAA